MAPPSFKDDSTRVMHVIVLVVFSFLAVLAVGLRLWARKILRNTWEISDYLIISGLVWTLGLTIFTTWSNVDGRLGENATQLGNPQAQLDLVALQLKCLLVGQTVWAVAVFLIRASVLTLYIRVFRTPWFRRLGYVVQAFNAAFFVSTIFAVLLICRPFAFTWNKGIRGGKCGDQVSLDLYLGIFNLLLDVTVVFLPMPVLWGLQIPLNKKLILSGMFGLGTIICVVTLVRIKFTTENHGFNSQRVYALVSLFANLEALLGTINACLPVLKPIYNKIASNKCSTWLSSVVSGSIPIFIRRSQMGSAWKSTKRRSTYKQPIPEELSAWSPTPNNGGNNKATANSARSPPPRYVDTRTERPKHNMDASIDPAPETPKPPVPPKSRVYSPTGRWRQGDEKEDNAIYVERSWDVERGGSADSADSDVRGLVRGVQRW